MIKNKQQIFIVVFIALLLASWALVVRAGTSNNVSGYAWSENIGWISFNNTSGGGATNYGVNINPSTGNFSGYAWSENIGWITFNRPETGEPPSDDPCKSNSACIAKVTPKGQIGKSNVDIIGWARALSFGGGWDGWIRFDHKKSGKPYIDSSGNFYGWAWGSDVVGWINLRDALYGVKLDLSFFNQPPDKPGIDPDYPDGEIWNHCSFGGRSDPTFYWTYSDPDGDPQTAYEIEADDDDSFDAPKFNHLVNLAATSYVFYPFQDSDLDWLLELDWNSIYFWRVRVKDNQGNWSEWSNADNLKTPPKAYPWPGFSWSPPKPTQGEIVIFSAAETGFSYFWDITKGTGVYKDETGPTNREPHIKFSTLDNRMKLTITDSSPPSPARSCEEEKDVAVQLPLPEYKEVPPIIRFKNFLASIIDFFNNI